MKKKILLCKVDNFYIYLHQLATLLKEHNFEVHVLFFKTEQIEPLYMDLKKDLEMKDIKCLVMQNKSCQLTRIFRILQRRLKFNLKNTLVSFSNIRKAKKLLKNENYDFIIAFDPPALFISTKLFSKSIDKIIEYSLELIDETHPLFNSDVRYREYVLFERKLMPYIAALIIQDEDRAKIILDKSKHFDRKNLIIYPVAINEEEKKQSSGFYQNHFGLPIDSKIIVYFGGLWKGSEIELLSNTALSLPSNCYMVVQGGRGNLTNILENSKLFFYRETVDFDRIYYYLTSAHIGLSLYSKNNNNERLTAFSSEKIARYTQCGLPFIAYNTKSYLFLKNRVDCCELIDDITELPEAVIKILNNYDYYRQNSFIAFKKYYYLPNTKKRLIDYLTSNYLSIN